MVTPCVKGLTSADLPLINMEAKEDEDFHLQVTESWSSSP
jgi:hypothetical protein